MLGKLDDPAFKQFIKSFFHDLRDLVAFLKSFISVDTLPELSEKSEVLLFSSSIRFGVVSFGLVNSFNTSLAHSACFLVLLPDTGGQCLTGIQFAVA